MGEKSPEENIWRQERRICVIERTCQEQMCLYIQPDIIEVVKSQEVHWAFDDNELKQFAKKK